MITPESTNGCFNPLIYLHWDRKISRSLGLTMAAPHGLNPIFRVHFYLFSYRAYAHWTLVHMYFVFFPYRAMRLPTTHIHL